MIIDSVGSWKLPRSYKRELEKAGVHVCAFRGPRNWLKKLRLKRIAPAHGYVIEEPKVVVKEYIEHRLAREAEILKTLGSDTMRVEDIVTAVYGEVDEEVIELATNNVLCHLAKLRSDGQVKGTKNFTAV